jgi:hypothetical protein
VAVTSSSVLPPIQCSWAGMVSPPESAIQRPSSAYTAESRRSTTCPEANTAVKAAKPTATPPVPSSDHQVVPGTAGSRRAASQTSTATAAKAGSANSGVACPAYASG